ncbi:MAG: phosphonate ABC transporter substrate-binding protein [Erysipelotrichaceae bacterium]|nr:phosphonate ABC transporter substrate-binding protein [Erysipelotrichaceae bacterium]MBQ9987342.1 PhnD/SsuA/transferrin family substrate-binding protein [Erysipelotrichales bacterium]MBR3694238.1 PhnD/SsuA/transferrin family substrate-binding protein [Erysipelotrichales bacterium]
MKKLLTVMLAFLMLVGCSTTNNGGTNTDSKHIEDLELQFVPSKDADVIITGTKNLPELLQAALAEEGYTVDEINVTVGNSYDATGEAMAAGTVDVGWLPGGTYALYSDETEVILTCTRNGLSNDSENPADWNGEENKTLKDGPQVGFYRSLIYAAPTEKGKALAEKVNNGEALTWEELDAATWAVQKTSSSAGYIYPTLWLMENYDKKISDLSNVVLLDSGYGTAFAQAAAEQVDIIVCYADGRNDYEASWNIPVTEADETGKAGLGREVSIWEELNVIGVTDGIYNDTVAVSKAVEEVYNEEFITALQNAIIAVINTEEGKAIFDVYSHTGYVVAKDSDYDGARAALELVK